MAEITTKYSPLHRDCTVGQPYGNKSPSYTCGFHTGIDFPASGAGGGNPELFSVCENATVVQVRREKALGNVVLIYDENNKLYYRYCHLLDNSTVVKVGDKVNLSSKLANMGNTGNSTGTHLHLECATTKAWQCSSFLNPGQKLGIPNVRGTIVHWDNVEPPTPPPSPTKKKRNNWAWANSKNIIINI